MMDNDVLLLLGSFCRVCMQDRPVFSTISQSYLGDVGSLIREWQSIRGNPIPIVQAFLQYVTDASAQLKTKRDRLIFPWLLCSLLLEGMADPGKLYWQCEHTRRMARFPSSANCVTLDEYDSRISDSSTVVPEVSKLPSQSTASTSRSALNAGSLHKPISAHDASTVNHPICQKDHGLGASKFFFSLTDCAESKDVLLFCAKMIQRRKYFRSCCIRRLDDCCDGRGLEECLKASSVHVVFVQQSIHAHLKEIFIRCNVLFLERLGRRTVDASEKTLQWTVFENLSHWLFILRIKSSQMVWRCWAATTQHHFGLVLELHVRHDAKIAGQGTVLIQSTPCIDMGEPALHESNSELNEIKQLAAVDDIEAFLLRNSCVAALLYVRAEGRVNGRGVNATTMFTKETVMRTLEIVCQMSRALM